ncbi:guanine nucleotide-binding protein subunit gamma [Moniliophthora roreri]|nr:guanine nucleotide-binding protein subunit gamma [Moniliophthora roreri]
MDLHIYRNVSKVPFPGRFAPSYGAQWDEPKTPMPRREASAVRCNDADAPATHTYCVFLV